MRRILLIIIALALLASLVVLRSRSEKPVTASDSATARGPWFEVQVEKPLLNRPFWEIPAALLGVPNRGPGAALPPSRRPSGYFRTTTRTDSQALDGTFLVELARCENVETGRPIEWPSSPLSPLKGLPPEPSYSRRSGAARG